MLNHFLLQQQTLISTNPLLLQVAHLPVVLQQEADGMERTEHEANPDSSLPSSRATYGC